MREIKRVLWVDDCPDMEVGVLFRNDETKQVSLMEDAIKEIASDHLYEYDTIVFDIDFENGLPNPDIVIEELAKRIYLDSDNRKNDFIINNGGYLLFIYLLERGYPSKQVAFLTGNPGMLDKLREYSQRVSAGLKKEEIAHAYKKAWDDAGEGEDAWDIFLKNVESLPVSKEYISEDAILQCTDWLEKNDYESLKEYIYSISPKPITAIDVQNTGDLMIYRFHEANLEPPVFFTKRRNYIRDHDKGDAEAWLERGRTEDRRTRWLILSAGNIVKSLFDEDQDGMRHQIGQLFSGINTDPGIWSSFSQLYNLFYSLRNIEQRGPYYQAISAMLIPFDKSPVNSGNNAVIGDNYINVRRALARLSKQARNYCAHNYFGSSISNKTALFIIMGTMSAVLSESQRESVDDYWYKNVKEIILQDHSYDCAANIQKIDDLCNALISNEYINMARAFQYSVPGTYEEYTPRDILRVLGYNTRMDLEHEISTSRREAYYLFTLAAYVAKWFEGLSEEELSYTYGEGIGIMFQISNKTIDEYEYPDHI